MKNYMYLESQIEELEAQIEELENLYFAVEDEDEAEDLYGEELDELRSMVKTLQSECDQIEEDELTSEYWHSVL